MGELDALMLKPTSRTQLAVFLFADSRWNEPHDAVQCCARGSTFKFLLEFQTEVFSNFLFKFQVVRASNPLTIEGPLYVEMLSFRSSSVRGLLLYIGSFDVRHK
jgi:hypothetical protein